MAILVIGGTGKTGGAALRELRALGVQAASGARRGADVTVDVADAAGLEAAARGFDAVYLLTPLGPDEAEIGLRAVAALRAAGVRKIVYLAIQNLDTMQAIPHFATKIPVRDAVLAATGVVLGANFFMDNDAMLLPAITQAGIYPLPVGGTGVWSIASPDIGAAAANALTRDDWNGRYVPVCGPERLTGHDYAASWAAVLGRPIAYAGDDTGPFLAATGIPPGWLHDDMRIMFEETQRLGCVATPADVQQARAIIGRKPLTHRQFAQALVERIAA